MLFDQLPTWALVALMFACCVIKHAAVKRFAHTAWFRKTFRERHWRASLFIMCMMGGAGTYIIFSKFTETTWALIFALVDFSLYVMFGIRARTTGLLEKKGTEYLRDVLFARLLLLMASVEFIWLTITLG